MKAFSAFLVLSFRIACIALAPNFVFQIRFQVCNRYLAFVLVLSLTRFRGKRHSVAWHSISPSNFPDLNLSCFPLSIFIFSNRSISLLIISSTRLSFSLTNSHIIKAPPIYYQLRLCNLCEITGPAFSTTLSVFLTSNRIELILRLELHFQ